MDPKREEEAYRRLAEICIEADERSTRKDIAKERLIKKTPGRGSANVANVVLTSR